MENNCNCRKIFFIQICSQIPPSFHFTSISSSSQNIRKYRYAINLHILKKGKTSNFINKFINIPSLTQNVHFLKILNKRIKFKIDIREWNTLFYYNRKLSNSPLKIYQSKTFEEIKTKLKNYASWLHILNEVKNDFYIYIFWI